MIEVVVAITLLTVALIAIMSMAPMTNAAARQAEVRLQAETLAQSVLERERLKPVLDPQPPTMLPEVYGLHPALEVLKTGAGDRAREIRVTVYWEGYGRNCSLSQSTVVTPLQR